MPETRHTIHVRYGDEETWLAVAVEAAKRHLSKSATVAQLSTERLAELGNAVPREVDHG